MHRLLMAAGLLALVAGAVLAGPLPDPLDGVRLAQTIEQRLEEMHRRNQERVGAMLAYQDALFPPSGYQDAMNRLQKLRAENGSPLEIGVTEGWSEYYLAHYTQACDIWASVTRQAEQEINAALQGKHPANLNDLLDSFEKFIEEKKTNPREKRLDVWKRYREACQAHGGDVPDSLRLPLLHFGEACFGIGVTHLKFGRFQEAVAPLADAMASGYSFEGNDGFRLSADEGKDPAELLRQASGITEILTSLHKYTITDHDGTLILNVYYDEVTPRVRVLVEDSGESVVEDFQRLKSFYRYLDPLFLAGFNWVTIFKDDPRGPRMAHLLENGRPQSGGQDHFGGGSTYHLSTMLVVNQERTLRDDAIDSLRHCLWGHKMDERVRISYRWFEGLAEAVKIHTAPNGPYLFAVNLGFLRARGLSSYRDSMNQTTGDRSREAVVYAPQNCFYNFLLARGNPATGMDGYQCQTELTLAMLRRASSKDMDAVVIPRIYGATPEVLWDECFGPPDWDVRLWNRCSRAFGWRGHYPLRPDDRNGDFSENR